MLQGIDIGGASSTTSKQGLHHALHAFTQDMIQATMRLTAEGERRACLVLDSETPFEPKRRTTIKRESDANHALNIAARLCRRSKQQDISDIIQRHARAHTRFTRDIKKTVVEVLRSGLSFTVYALLIHYCPCCCVSMQLLLASGIRQYQQEMSSLPPLSFFVSLREADAQVVYLAASWPGRPAIMSRDGDLFAYGGALNCLVRIQTREKREIPGPRF